MALTPSLQVEDTVTQQKFEWQKGDPEKWMPSFAASMTAAYCIGAEDRHARNIMIQECQDSKRVFQIDFAYIWGTVRANCRSACAQE